MGKVSDYLKQVKDVQFNPHGTKRVVTRALKDMTRGEYEFFDPTNPVVYAIECAVMLTTAAVQRNETLVRKQYPELAQSYEDLYNHMSDEDYMERFAKPNKASVRFLMSYDEIVAKSIDDGTGVRKVVIPRDTVVTVDGLDLTIVYPVEIRIQPHGGMQIVYDASEQNPLYTLNTNVVPWRLVNMPDQAQELSHLKMVVMDVDFLQVTNKSYYDQLNSFTGFSKEFAFNDKYHHARVYMLKDDNSEWVEIGITHSEQVHDPMRVTATLQVLEDTLKVSIPSIYFTRNMVYSNIRVDIFTTRGKLNLSLARYTPSSYEATWDDKRRKPEPVVSAIQNIDTMLLMSESILNKGTNGVSFDELRRRVISNSVGNRDIPITPNQLETDMKDRGFDIIKEIDHITNRLYVATRGLESPTNGSVSTPLGCLVQPLRTTIGELLSVSTVKENGDRLTIESGTLFELRQGVLHVVDDRTKNDVLQGTLENMVTMVSDREFLYNPIHYVIDRTNKLRTRGYYLDNPSILSKEFIAENASTGLEIITLRYGMSKTPTGFKIVIYSKRSDNTKELVGTKFKLQLRYKPANEQVYAYIDVPFVGLSELDEMLFEADLHTSFDVDDSDNIVFTNFTVNTPDPVITYCPLETKMELIYIIEDYHVEDIRRTEIDRATSQFYLSDESYGVMHEAINVHFGYALKDVWSRSLTVVDERNIARYDRDVPLLWDEDQYERDPLTKAYKLEYNEETGLITTVKLYNKGDQVVYDGVPQFKARAGDPKLDNYGRPIPLSNRQTAIITDLLLFEGAYYFADERSAITTRNEAIENIVNWVVNDMSGVKERLLENTAIMFKPKQNIGWVDVYVNNATETSISSSQRFNIKVYMNANTYDNYSVRADLERMAKEIIVSELSNRTVSVINMAKRIKDAAIEGVIDVSVYGLGGDADYDVITTKDATVSLSLAKKIDILSDQTLTVRDDIDFEYVKHTKN